LSLLKKATQTRCYHCDDNTSNPVIGFGHTFCCEGCKTVYEILSNNDLCNYYEFAEQPGVKPKETDSSPFEHLDSEAAFKRFGVFEDHNIRIVKLNLPYMHCSSCVWLLEKLHQIEPSITDSRVDFFKKEIKISYKKDGIQLSQCVALLHRLGYAPDLSWSNTDQHKASNKHLVSKMGVAGFCFGNIMLLNFPEYLDTNFKLVSPDIAHWFTLIALFLSIPALAYGASDFFVSAYKSIRSKTLNIDLPISIAILATFIRSVYDIAFGIGPGFLDTMCGIIFLMLAGRWFQDFTYKHIYFERNFKNYFPLFVSRLNNNEVSAVQVEELIPGDIIHLKHGEITPTDSILKSVESRFDLSFITGESKLIHKKEDDYIYAGAKVMGNASDLLVVKPVSRGYLTGIWENDQDREELKDENLLTEKISKYFSIIILAIAVLGFMFWSLYSMQNAFNVFTAILIIACPCTLLLATTFTYGHAIRYMGRAGLYLKQNGVINKLGQITLVAFDKTGTLTDRLNNKATFLGDESKLSDLIMLASQSNHPVNIAICKIAQKSNTPIFDFEQHTGKGIEGKIQDQYMKIGKATYVNYPIGLQNENATAYATINNQPVGYFILEQSPRKGVIPMLKALRKKLKISLFSGDNDTSKATYEGIIEQMQFFLRPDEKQNEIEKLQHANEKVLMIGDGLNDALALKTAHCGLAVAESENCFFPSCDGLLKADQIHKLPQILTFIKKVNKVILISFGFSLVYNLVGISFALTNMLSPLVAAVLMPTCSITIIVATWLLIRHMYQKYLAV